MNNHKKKMFYLGNLRDLLFKLFAERSIPAYLHVSEIHQNDRCFYFEIESKKFDVDIFNYLSDFSDFLEVIIYDNKSTLFKVSFNYEF